LIRSLDERFEGILSGEDRRPAVSHVRGNTPLGLLVLAVLLIVNWGAVFFPFSALLAVHGAPIN
jgi:hypothetical protein